MARRNLCLLWSRTWLYVARDLPSAMPMKPISVLRRIASEPDRQSRWQSSEQRDFKEFTLHRRHRVVFDVDRMRECSVGYTRNPEPIAKIALVHALAFSARKRHVWTENARCNAKNTIVSHQSDVRCTCINVLLFYHTEKNRREDWDYLLLHFFRIFFKSSYKSGRYCKKIYQKVYMY